MSDDIEKLTGKLDDSFFTYYSWDTVNLLKKQFNIVDQSQPCTSSDNETALPNSLYIVLGYGWYPAVRDMIEMSHDVDVRS